MSNAPLLLQAGSVMPDWLEWVLIGVFFVGPTLLGWVRKLLQGTAQTPTAPASPKPEQPKPERSRPERTQPASREAVRRQQSVAKDTRPASAARPVAPSRPSSQRGAPAAPVATSAKRSSKSVLPFTQRKEAEQEALRAEVLRQEQAKAERRVRSIVSLGSLSGGNALAAMLGPLAALPGVKEVLDHPDVVKAINDRLSLGSVPWRLTSGFQVAGVSIAGRVPGLRAEIYAAAGLPEEGIQISSLQELQSGPEVLTASWVEILFADALGLAVAGPAWARARIGHLVANRALSDIHWDVRSGTMVLNPPACIMAPVMAHVLRQASLVRESQEIEALADELTAAPLTLHIQGLGRPVHMQLPEEVLVIESQQMLRRLMGTSFASLGRLNPGLMMQTAWPEVGPGIRNWVQRLEAGEVDSKPSLATAFGVLVACTSFEPSRVESLLAAAESNGLLAGSRSARAYRATAGGLGELPDAQALIESMLVGSLMGPPVSRRQARRSGSLL